MNKLIPFIFGVVVGVSGTYYYFQRKIKETVERKVTEELRKPLEATSIDIPVAEVEEIKRPELKKEKPIIEAVNTHETTYSQIVETYTNPEKVLKEENQMPIFADAKKEFPDPYLITEEQHYEDDDTYDLTEAEYNSIDDMLRTGLGEAIDDIDFTVGRDNLIPLIDGKTDEVIVRNEFLQVDYFITLNNDN